MLANHNVSAMCPPPISRRKGRYYQSKERPKCNDQGLDRSELSQEERERKQGLNRYVGLLQMLLTLEYVRKNSWASSVAGGEKS
jgi:hypothetical protein